GDIQEVEGFPGEDVRRQPGIENQTSIREGKKGNLGNPDLVKQGIKANRDASLIFDDQEIAEYLAQVFDYDWNRLATGHPTQKRARVARAGEATPPGFKRVPFSAVFED